MNNQKRPQVVAHPETGEVVTPNPKKPQFGSVRIDQEVVSVEGGFLNRQNRVAFLGGRVEDLQSMGYKEGQKLPGKIIIKESLTPFYADQTPKINPETDEVLTQNGNPIYRDLKYTENINASDSLLEHDTVDQTISESEGQTQEEEMSITA